MKVNRNSLCPCGSGKKRKKCCEGNNSYAPLPPPLSSSIATATRRQTGVQWQQQNQELNLQLGLQHHQAGDLAQAARIYQQILHSEPHHAGALHLLGFIAHQKGNYELAVELISKAIAKQSTNAKFYFDLGNALKEIGKQHEAIDCFRRALRIEPDYADALTNLGTVLNEQGKLDEAIECYQHALRLRPDLAVAHNNLGLALSQQGKLDEAIECYQHALRLEPEYALAHSNIGLALGRQGKLDEAVEYYCDAVELQPDNAETHNNLGLILFEQKKFNEAVVCFCSALRLQPDNATAHFNLGNALKGKGHNEEAIECYRNAVRFQADFAEAHNNLGNVLKDLTRYDEAVESYHIALRHQPDFATAHINLAGAHYDSGDVERSTEHYQAALRLQPEDGLRIRLATALPPVPQSSEHLLALRQGFADNIATLQMQQLTIHDPAEEVGRTNFYLAYHGLNDVAIQKQVAQFYARSCPSLSYTAAHCLEDAPLPEETGKVRVGFVSKYFSKSHIVGKSFKGIIANLARNKISVTVFYFDTLFSDIHEALNADGDRAVRLPSVLEEAREKIAEEQLDVLLYTDIGMDAFTYYLAYSRLAPVQCVWPGHPVTTGIKNIDYFVSSDDDEPENAQEHYSEQLIRLRERPLYYRRSSLPHPLKPRADFGLEPDKHVYLCPMTPFKFHPEFDEMMADILRNDPSGQLVLVEHKPKQFTDALMARLRRNIPDVVDRIRLVPRQLPHDFLNLMEVSDAVLDTLHFGGGTTSLEAMAIGAPVVTLPGEFMRGRSTYGLYKQINVLDCVAKDKKDYVRIAVRLGTDPGFREKVKAETLANNSVLYENTGGVTELEEFLIEATRAGQNPARGFACEAAER